MKINLTKHDICNLLPHTGTMCLIDKILAWNDDSLESQTISHQNINNPLIYKGSINSVMGIEFAAQTMAIHAVLVHKKHYPDVQLQQSGYLATARSIEIFQEHLKMNNTEVNTPLNISVSCLMKDTQGYTYNFNIDSQEIKIISGKLTIFLV